MASDGTSLRRMPPVTLVRMSMPFLATVWHMASNTIGE
jgi:hypothetical protein